MSLNTAILFLKIMLIIMGIVVAYVIGAYPYRTWKMKRHLTYNTKCKFYLNEEKIYGLVKSVELPWVNVEYLSEFGYLKVKRVHISNIYAPW